MSPDLTLFIGDNADDEDGEGGEVMTYAPGEQFVIYRGMTAWVDPKIDLVDESPDQTFVQSDQEGLLPRGRYRWTGNEIAYLGRQKGPARPMG